MSFGEEKSKFSNKKSEASDAEGIYLVQKQLKALEEFENTFAKNLGFTDSISYLERWQKKTSGDLRNFLNGEQVSKLENIWLQQKFELDKQEQLKFLVDRFRNQLLSWEESMASQANAEFEPTLLSSPIAYKHSMASLGWALVAVGLSVFAVLKFI